MPNSTTHRLECAVARQLQRLVRQRRTISGFIWAGGAWESPGVSLLPGSPQATRSRAAQEAFNRVHVAVQTHLVKLYEGKDVPDEPFILELEV